jgi:hypothetical protein
MSQSHAHHFPRFASSRPGDVTARDPRDLVARAPFWQRAAVVTTVAALSGLGIGLAMPRGPVSVGQSMALLVVSALVGFLAGFVLRSRWAMLLAPAAQILVFELTRLGASGPTSTGSASTGRSRCSRSSSAAASTGSSACSR